MRKLATELRNLIKDNPFLEQGVREELFNTSALARAVQPLLEARLSKEVSVSAISMALSRLGGGQDQSKSGGLTPRRVLSTKELGIRSNLEVISFAQSGAARQGLERLYRRLQKREYFATLTEGVRELTLIFESGDVEVDFSSLGRPLLHKKGVGCIAIYFPKEYGSQPGFLYAVFQQLFFQGINVIEIASTSRELLVYVDESDLRLGFDTIYSRFVSRNPV